MSKTTENFSDITYWACGGTGINLSLELKKGAKTLGNKNARFIGLDSSDKNGSADQFVVERIEGALGSGKDKSVNFEKAIPFVEAVIKKHKAGRYNVIISNTAGGTGSMLAVLVARLLIQAGHVAVLCLVSDHTSVIEKENSVGGLTSFANQTAESQLGAPMCYIPYENTVDKTRGEVNEEIVGGLNLLSILFDASNTEMDYEDIKRIFNYSARGKVPPALSRIQFFDQKTSSDFEGKPPVAVASLFRTSNEIIPMFVGSMYRTTGVFGKDVNLPKEMTQLHIVLDHGDALAALQEEIEGVDEAKSKVAVDYTKQKDVSTGSNSLGMVL